MRAHIIKDGKIANTIEVDSLDFMPGLLSAENGGDIGDEFDGIDFHKPTPVEPSFEELKSEIGAKINAKFEAETALIKGRVTQNEIDTFITQETEAIAYQNDNNAIVPLIAGLASIRGLTIDDLSQRILAHATAYKTAIAQAMGKKHVLEDQLDSAQIINDLKSIEV